MKLAKDSLAFVRNQLDSADPYILSHEVKSPRQNAKHTPEEFSSTKGIQNFILGSFPLWKTKERQRTQAGRWVRIIQLHYKFHYSERMTAEEMELPLSTIKSIKTHIRRTLEGRRLDGSGRYWKKRGKE